MNDYRAIVYLSGGLRSNWQQKIISACEGSFLFFNPREHGLEPSLNHYTAWDLFHVRHCDILFAYMEDTNPSGLGLCIEVGYAKALGKTIILVDEKSLRDKAFASYFKIVRESCDVVFDNFEDAIYFLLKFRR